MDEHDNTIKEFLKFYRPSPEWFEKVEDIFKQNDGRYADPWEQIKLAAFFTYNAIQIEKRRVEKTPVNIDDIKGPQKEMKALMIEKLKSEGYNIEMEVGFKGGIVDVLATKDGKTIAVECGPCAFFKGITYLEHDDNTELWILKPVGNDYILYVIKRSVNWSHFLKSHEEYTMNRLHKAYEKIADMYK